MWICSSFAKISFVSGSRAKKNFGKKDNEIWLNSLPPPHREKHEITLWRNFQCTSIQRNPHNAQPKEPALISRWPSDDKIQRNLWNWKKIPSYISQHYITVPYLKNVFVRQEIYIYLFYYFNKVKDLFIRNGLGEKNNSFLRPVKNGSDENWLRLWYKFCIYVCSCRNDGAGILFTATNQMKWNLHTTHTTYFDSFLSKDLCSLFCQAFCHTVEGKLFLMNILRFTDQLSTGVQILPVAICIVNRTCSKHSRSCNVNNITVIFVICDICSSGF